MDGTAHTPQRARALRSTLREQRVVTRAAALHDIRCTVRLPAEDFRLLAFEILVDRKEVLDLTEEVRRSIAQPVIAVIQRVVYGYGQDLLVHALLIAHPEYADRPHDDETAGERRHRHHYENIEWVTIVSERAREEAVIARIVDRTVQQPVELEEAGVLVQLVLVAAPARDLDDRIQL